LESPKLIEKLEVEKKFKLNLERLNEVGELLFNFERSIEIGKSN